MMKFIFVLMMVSQAIAKPIDNQVQSITAHVFRSNGRIKVVDPIPRALTKYGYVLISPTNLNKDIDLAGINLTAEDLNPGNPLSFHRLTDEPFMTMDGEPLTPQRRSMAISFRQKVMPVINSIVEQFNFLPNEAIKLSRLHLRHTNDSEVVGSGLHTDGDAVTAIWALEGAGVNIYVRKRWWQFGKFQHIQVPTGVIALLNAEQRAAVKHIEPTAHTSPLGIQRKRTVVVSNFVLTDSNPTHAELMKVVELEKTLIEQIERWHEKVLRWSLPRYISESRFSFF